MSQSLSDVNARIKDVHLSSQTAYHTAKQGQENLTRLNQNLDAVSKEGIIAKHLEQIKARESQ